MQTNRCLSCITIMIDDDMNVRNRNTLPIYCPALIGTSECFFSHLPHLALDTHAQVTASLWVTAQDQLAYSNLGAPLDLA